MAEGLLCGHYTLLAGHCTVAPEPGIIQALLVPKESGSENASTLLAR